MKEVCPGAEEVHVMLGAATADAVAVAQVEARLSVKAQVRNFLFAAKQDLNFHRIRHNQWAMRQRMRSNRGNHDGVDGRHEHRSTGR